MRRVVVHAEASNELTDARDYYDEETPGLGLDFVESMEREFSLLVEFPRLGKPLVMGARRRVVRGWPYSIVYQPILGGIYVVAVAHHKRRPRYWRARLRR